MVEESLIENNHTLGLRVEGSSARVARTVLRDTLPEETSGDFGAGIYVRDADQPARTEVQQSLVSGNRSAGVYSTNPEVILEETAVLDTLPRARDNRYGVGVFCERTASGMPAALTMESGHVAGSRTVGIAVLSLGAVIRDSLVSQTAPEAGTVRYGAGIQVSGDPARGAASLREHSRIAPNMLLYAPGGDEGRQRLSMSVAQRKQQLERNKWLVTKQKKRSPAGGWKPAQTGFE